MNKIGDTDGNTALHLAVKEQKLDVARSLLARDACPDQTNNAGIAPIHYAAKSGNLELCQLLVSKLAKTYQKTKKGGGVAPLHIACEEGHLQIVKLLVDKGESLLQSSDISERTALHFASVKGHLQIVKFLVEEGGPIEKSDKDGSTALMLAVENKKIDVAEYLLASGARAIRANNNGIPLHYACEFGNLKLCRLLVDNMFEINMCDALGTYMLNVDRRKANGMTPLHVAFEKGHLQIVKFLVEECGADTELTDNDGNTALMLAKKCQKKDIADYLVMLDKRDRLHLACFKGDLPTVQRLVEHEKVDIEIGNKDCKNALLIALDYQEWDIARYLIEKGARVTRDNAVFLPLRIAAFHNNLEMCQLLVSRGANVNHQMKYDGMTPFLFACCSSNLHIVKFFFEECGADSEIVDKFGNTALLRAICNHDADVVEYLIANGARVDCVNNIGATPLHYASEFGELELCKLLVDNGADVNHQRKGKGATPLHAACDRGHLKIVKFLVEEVGADIEIAVNNGFTPFDIAKYRHKKQIVDYLAAVRMRDRLCEACAEGDLPTVKSLVEESGADFEIVDKYGSTPLMKALEYQNTDIVEYLVTKGARVNRADNDGVAPLHYAVDFGNVELCKLLLRKGADVNQQKKENGTTALHLACEKGQLEIVKFLVEKGGADIETVDNDGNTALLLAVENQNADIAEYLIAKGARVDCVNNNGVALLHYAAKFDFFELCKLLMNNGANVNQQTEENRTTPLHCACSAGHLQIVKFLIEECGADIEITNSIGNTALLVAVIDQKFDVAEYLVAKGARVDCTNNNGAALLHLATKFDDLELCKMLVDKGVNVNQKTNDHGITALHLACGHGHLQIVKFLVEEGGADIEIADIHDNTPIEFAKDLKHMDIVDYLIANGAKR